MSTPNPANKDETQISGGRKKLPPPEKTLNCPRCDSPNTKFCYYNNYSLTQPRHFCKTCRRYWTKGGALRNVPIGGGCRKNKKLLKSSKDSGDSSSDSGGFKFLNGLSPAMDFQLGSLNLTNPNSGPMKTSGYNNYNCNFNQFSVMADGNSTNSISVLGLDPSASGSLSPLMGFNFDGSLNFQSTNNNLASSIESLSSINQDLHWKLQQQRLAVLFGGQENQRKTEENNSTIFDNQKPQPILFENLEISKQGCVDEGGNSRTEWFFDNNNVNFAPVNVATTPANSESTTGNEMNGSSWSTGFQAWSASATNLNQYSALP
ncbi:hypothetical protein LguiA_013742 [Lonicera macranthoides]